MTGVVKGMEKSKKRGGILALLARSFSAFLVLFSVSVLLSHTAYAQEVAPKEVAEEATKEAPETKRVDDPFDAATAWVAIDGFEQKFIDDAVKAKEVALRLVEEARLKKEIVKRVQNLISPAQPLMTEPPSSKDIAKRHLLEEAEEKELLSPDKAEGEMKLIKNAQHLRQISGTESTKINLTTSPDETKRVDAPFGAAAAWLTLDGFEKKSIDDVVKAKEGALRLVEEARLKKEIAKREKEIAKRVQNLLSPTQPLMTEPPPSMSIAQPHLLEVAEETKDVAETKWGDDPFGAAAAWLTVDRFAKKSIDDAVKAEEVALRLIEVARLKAEIAKRVQNLLSPAQPLMTEPPPTMDVAQPHLFEVAQEKEWLSLDEADEEMKLIRNAQHLRQIFGSESTKINFTTLPDTSIKVSVASKISKSRSLRERRIAALGKVKKAKKDQQKKKMKKETEDCKAVSAYRRRQLAAMESDRETLTALKSALNELGLSKKLSFMGGGGKSMAKMSVPTNSKKGSAGDILHATP